MSIATTRKSLYFDRMSCATFLFAKSVSLGIPCKVLLIELAKDTFLTSGNLLVISKIAADLLSLFSKLSAKSFIFRTLLHRVALVFDANDYGDDCFYAD